MYDGRSFEEACDRADKKRQRKFDKSRVPKVSDEALALEFAEIYGGHLRYVAAWNKWLRWDGKHWQFDETLAVFDLVRKICRRAASQCTGREAKALASAKTVVAVAGLVRSDRRLAATVDQWDIDPWLLNTPNGVVDLRTGKSRQHRPDDYMTKLTGVAPNPACPIPIWLSFLERIMAGDKELIAFLQRMAGYALTGLTQEHALFFLYGTGSNGKSTYLNAITGCAGDYHRTAAIETFVACKGEHHPTDLAGLRGARFVTSLETEEGRPWAESKIKALTGGDKIAARFMRQDFFEFTPTFKLVIAGNHKPALRSVDEAIRRRFNLVPFTITILAAERDLTLPERLKAEWPGILAWMIDGCLDWQDRGLAAPEAVQAATATYLESEDMFGTWLDECCERDVNAWEGSRPLFASWSAWAERSGEQRGDTRQFRERLEGRGVHYKRQGGTGGRGYRGLRLRPPDEPAESYWDKL
jgi:putative DNA primase/helicase